MKLSDLQLFEDEFDVFVSLSPTQKLAFIKDINSSDLDSVLEKYTELLPETVHMLVSSQEMYVGDKRLSIIQFDDFIRINADSLKLIRSFTRKLWMDGIIMKRVKAKKSGWDDMKYLQVYRIISQHGPICEN